MMMNCPEPWSALNPLYLDGVSRYGYDFWSKSNLVPRQANQKGVPRIDIFYIAKYPVVVIF
jgi:hypothetical protein